MGPGDIILTNQRHEILELLRKREDHPSVDQIFEAVRRKLPRISRATVYKNLRYLSERGLIKEVNVKGVARFEAKTRPHHHMICTGCGRIMDFESDELTEFALAQVQGRDDFEVETADTHFHGRCEDCR